MMSSFESWQPGVGDSCVLGLPRWTLASVGQQAGRQASQPGRVAAIRLEGELSESDGGDIGGGGEVGDAR